jgi:hypothetical protein
MPRSARWHDPAQCRLTGGVPAGGFRLRAGVRAIGASRLRACLRADFVAGRRCGIALFLLRTKGEVEQAVQALGYPSLTVVRPSLIGRERQRRRLLEHIGMRLLQTLAPCAPRRYRIVSAERIAHTLLRPALEMAPRLVGDLPGAVAVVRENQGDARGTPRL